MQQLREHIQEITTVSDEEFEYIKTFFVSRKVKKHQYLLQEGDQINFEYLVLSGIFRMFYLDYEGKEHIVQFAGDGWWISDYQAYFKEQPARLHITCMEEGEVLCMKLGDGMTDYLIGLTPLGRIGKPKEIGHLVAFLSSDKAAFITVSDHTIDGGSTLL